MKKWRQAFGQLGLVTTFVSTILGGGCDDVAAFNVPQPDFAEFETQVYPILARDCGFVGCHGDPARYFYLTAPGRIRLDPEMDLFDPVTPEELASNYDHSRAMLAGNGAIINTPLLRKPREGAGHAGLDAKGRNVYSGRHDPSYAQLEAWAVGGVW